MVLLRVFLGSYSTAALQGLRSGFARTLRASYWLNLSSASRARLLASYWFAASRSLGEEMDIPAK